MKKTDLAKNDALKLVEKMRKNGIPDRFSGATDASAAPARREQRKLDQAQGLVSFPVKINQDIVTQIRAMAESEGISTSEVTGRLLESALSSVKPAA